MTVTVPPEAIRIADQPKPWLESQLAGVVAGVLLTAIVGAGGWWLTVRRSKDRGRLRLMNDLELQIIHCDRLTGLLQDFEGVVGAELAAIRDVVNTPSVREDLLHFSDSDFTQKIQRWYVDLFFAVETAVDLTTSTRELERRGGERPLGHADAVAACRLLFQRQARAGRRIRTQVWAADRWWNWAWVRRVRRWLRRRFPTRI